MPPESQPFSTAFFVWLVAGSLSGLVFVIGVQQAQLPARGVGAVFGAVACLVALIALTVVVRSSMSPGSAVGAVVIYTIGIGAALVISLCYAFFFMFWHAKNF